MFSPPRPEIFQATTKYLLQRYPSVYAFEVWNEPNLGSGGVLKKLKKGGKPGGNVKRGWRNYRMTWSRSATCLAATCQVAGSATSALARWPRSAAIARSG